MAPPAAPPIDDWEPLATGAVTELVHARARRTVRKRVRRDHHDTTHAAAMVRHEADLLEALAGLAVPSISARGEDAHGPWFEMPWLQGTPLDALAERERARPERVREVARSVATTLAALHAQGGVHRDVSPANVWVPPEGPVLLLDFGTASSALPSCPRDLAPAGTPGFAPPEQLVGEPSTPRSDVWALAAVLRWMLTGAPLFQGSAAVVVARTVEQDPASLGAAHSLLPSALSAWIDVALTRDPTRRTASLEDLLTALA